MDSNWQVSEIYEPEVPVAVQPEKTKLTLKEQSVEDRPREKLAALGAENLSTAELLAIIIGGGTPKETAVDLAKRMLRDCNDSLNLLGKMTLAQLKHYEGIGDAKAISIMAACELGRRRQKEDVFKREVLDTPQLIYEHLYPQICDLDTEEAFVVLLNQACKHLKTVRLSHGGLTETSVDVRLIIKEAVLCNATIVAVAHNHPSGNTRPSRDDDHITHAVKEACRTMRLHFMDHIIVAESGYYSYFENGKL